MKALKAIVCAAAAMLSLAAVAQKPLVVAHRGYWKTGKGIKMQTATESAQNSIRSLCKADSIHCWGSEFDIWLTKDGQVFVNHDATINGVEIQKSLAKDVAGQKVPNGEYISTLDQYLQEFTKHPNIQVVLEVKPHADLIQESMCVMKALALVKHYELENRVTYITFSPNAMCELIKYEPKGTEVYYLNGEMPPKKLKEIGAAGMDYHYKVFMAHPEWIKECHDLGLKTNAWTVNKKEDLQWCIDNGIDFITTNEPVLLQKMLK